MELRDGRRERPIAEPGNQLVYYKKGLAFHSIIKWVHACAREQYLFTPSTRYIEIIKCLSVDLIKIVRDCECYWVTRYRSECAKRMYDANVNYFCCRQQHYDSRFGELQFEDENSSYHYHEVEK